MIIARAPQKAQTHGLSGNGSETVSVFKIEIEKKKEEEEEKTAGPVTRNSFSA